MAVGPPGGRPAGRRLWSALLASSPSVGLYVRLFAPSLVRLSATALLSGGKRHGGELVGFLLKQDAVGKCFKIGFLESSQTVSQVEIGRAHV